MAFKRISVNRSFTEADFETTLSTVRESLLQEDDVILCCELSDDETEIVIDHLMNSFQQLTDRARELTSRIVGPLLETRLISVRLMARNFRAEAAEAQVIDRLIKTMRSIELAQGVLRVGVGGLVTVGISNQQEKDWCERLERKLLIAWDSFVPTIVEKVFAPQVAPGQYRLTPIQRWMPRTVVVFSVDLLGQATRMRLVTSSGNAVMDKSAMSALRSAFPYEQPAAGSTELQAVFRIVADHSEEEIAQEHDIFS